MNIIRSFRVFVSAILALGLLLVVAVGSVSAHASVVSATPGIGASIVQVPTQVTVITAENMNPDPKASNLFVYSPDGELISKGNATIDKNNPKEMSVTINPKGQGIYIVRWTTVSAEDSDPDEGAFTFTVKPGTASKATTGTGTPNATGGTSGVPVAFAMLLGGMALLVGLGAGFALGRSRGKVSTIPNVRSAASPGQEREEVSTKGDN